MRPLLVVFLAGILVGGPISVTAQEDYAHMMMILTNPAFGERESVEKRYRFLLPRIAESCADAKTPDRVADMVYVSHKRLDEAGLGRRESLLAITETLHRLMREIGPAARRVGVPIKCAEVFAMYLVVRLDGMSPEESRNGIAAVVKGLYKLAN